MEKLSYAEEFAMESERKEKLLELFEKIEIPISGKKTKEKFARILSDHVEITKIQGATLEVTRENGETIFHLVVSHEITKLLRVSDELFLTLAQKNGQWFVVYVQMIASQMRGNAQVH